MMDRTEFARSVHDWLLSLQPANRTAVGEVAAAIVGDAGEWVAHEIELRARPVMPTVACPPFRVPRERPVASVTELPGAER